ncbi:unnamed protein product [Arctia plantaginis]|uniref:MOSC domain-containing protein n=1 Tax=Arctia plantaginis TaxID=874455 RepID=A0A8S1AT30_ARCPL|nr:unnamed protein product [Arctia plantaginis]
MLWQWCPKACVGLVGSTWQSVARSSGPILAAAMCTAGFICGVYHAYHLYQAKKRKEYVDNLPEEWVQVGYVKGLNAYPVKSCTGVPLNNAECSPLGLRDDFIRDRILMVVTAEDNVVIRFKAYPELIRIKPTFKKSILTLKHPKMQPIVIDLKKVKAKEKTTRATISSACVPVYDCGDEVNEWITKCLDDEDTKFRLVYYASENSRERAGDVTRWPNIYDVLRPTDTGAFADEVTYHVLNEASVDDLNFRLKLRGKELQVDETRFRANIYVSGCKPFDEDNWKYVKIGENVFQVIKPCIRCIATVVNPETGVRDKSLEPLETLRSYRQATDPAVRKEAGNAPLMGIHMALRSEPGGIISLNNPIYVAY